MKIYIKRLHIIHSFVLLFIATSLYAQGGRTTYYGALDNVYPIVMVLEQNETSIEGHYIFVDSGERYTLNGIIKEGLFQLLEYDSAGLHSANIELASQNGQLEGSWQSLNDEAYFTIVAHEDKSNFDRIFSKYLRKFEGKLNGERISLIIANMANNQVNGKIYYQDKKETFRIRGTCTGLDCSKMELNIKDDLGNSISSIVVDKTAEGLWHLQNPGSPVINLERTYQRKLNTLGRSHYNILYDFVYPNWPNLKYQEWVRQNIREFQKKCEETFEAMYGDEIGKRPSYRASIQAYGWVELDYLSNSFISGLFHFQYPNQEVTTMPFSYYAENGEAFELTSSFKKSFKHEEFISERKAIEKKKMIQKNDFLADWIRNNEFENQTIRQDGICFSTDFHTRYGKLSFVIPYADFKRKIKRKSSIAELIEPHGNK